MSNITDKSIPWELIYNDTFSGETSVDKSGNNILQGFYLLWYHTLLESVKDATENHAGKVLTVPAKGFNIFRLVYSLNNERFSLELDLDSYLAELYKIKIIIFENFKGYDFAKNKKEVLNRFSDAHCYSYLSGNKIKIYEDIIKLSKIVNLNFEILNSNTDDMLINYIDEFGDNDDFTENTSMIPDKPTSSDSFNRH